MECNRSFPRPREDPPGRSVDRRVRLKQTLELAIELVFEHVANGSLEELARLAFQLATIDRRFLKGTADPSNAKVLRAGMGATFRLPITRATGAELKAWASENRVTLWVADTEGTPLFRQSPADRLAVIVGNEGAGVSREIAGLATNRVAIPLANGVESLNVAVAVGILLYEVQRAG